MMLSFEKRVFVNKGEFKANERFGSRIARIRQDWHGVRQTGPQNQSYFAVFGHICAWCSGGEVSASLFGTAVLI